MAAKAPVAQEKAPAAPKAKKDKPVLQYYHDGQPMSEDQNKLSSIAYWYTENIPGAKYPGKRGIGGKALVALLKELGIENPRTEAFKVTLPNGIVLSATVQKDGKLVPLVPRSQRPKQDPAAAKARRSVTKAQRAKLTQDALNESKAVTAWKKGGEVGPKPEMPATAELEALLQRKPTKGSAKVAKQSVGVKPTNVGRGAKKVPATKKAPAKAKAPGQTASAKPFKGTFPKKAAASKKTA